MLSLSQAEWLRRQAVLAVAELSTRPDARRSVVLVGAGDDRVSGTTLDDLRERLTEADAALYVIRPEGAEGHPLQDVATATGGLVVPVGTPIEIREKIRSALKETLADPKVKQQLADLEHLLDHAGHRIGPIKDGDVGQIEPVFLETLDLVDHKTGLVVLVLSFESHDRETGPPVGPQVFRGSFGVVGDDRVGRFQNGLGGPVVLVEDDHPGVGVILLEVAYVADVGSAELVNRLVGVTHNAEVAVGGGELVDQHVLSAVGVLVFVDQDVAEALLVVLEDTREGGEQFDGDHEQIVEIHG